MARQRCSLLVSLVNKGPHRTERTVERRCTREAGHDGQCRWQIGEEASWLPDAPREIQDEFSKLLGRRR